MAKEDQQTGRSWILKTIYAHITRFTLITECKSSLKSFKLALEENSSEVWRGKRNAVFVELIRELFELLLAYNLMNFQTLLEILIDNENK